MARATAVKMPPEASAVHGCEGARRVLALMLAFSTDRNTLTARDLATATGETVILVRLIGRSAVCVHRVQSAQRLRISFEAGQPLPLERGASARLLLSGLPPEQRREYLSPLAERDPEAAARLEIKAAQAAQQGYATSEEELETGVFAVSAPVFQGKRMIAVITVPSPLVRAPAPLQENLLSQVRAAA